MVPVLGMQGRDGHIPKADQPASPELQLQWETNKLEINRGRYSVPTSDPNLSMRVYACTHTEKHIYEYTTHTHK